MNQEAGIVRCGRARKCCTGEVIFESSLEEWAGVHLADKRERCCLGIILGTSRACAQKSEKYVGWWARCLGRTWSNCFFVLHFVVLFFSLKITLMQCDEWIDKKLWHKLRNCWQRDQCGGCFKRDISWEAEGRQEKEEIETVNVDTGKTHHMPKSDMKLAVGEQCSVVSNSLQAHAL